MPLSTAELTCATVRRLARRTLAALALLAAAGTHAQVQSAPTVQGAPSLTRVAGRQIGTTFFAATDDYENFPGAGVPLGGLHAVVADAARNAVYVTDTGSSTVRRLDLLTGRMTTIAGIPGAAGFSGDGGPATQARLNSPSGLALDAAGALYVADTGNHCIRRFTPGSTITTVAGNAASAGDTDGPPGSGSLQSPYSLALDALGNLLIGDDGNLDVRVFAPGSGLLSTLIGAGTNGYPSNFHPRGLAYVPAGLVVSDYYNHRLLLFNGTQLSVYAGTGVSQSSKNSIGDGGPKEAAGFTNTAGLLYDDAHGTLDIVDGQYLRQIAVTAAAEFPAGTIRTIAGLGVNYGGPDTIKVAGNYPVSGQGSTPPGFAAVALLNGDFYLVGGYDPFGGDNGLGRGSILRLSQDDGTVLSRFYTAGSPRISFQLPAGTVWDAVAYSGANFSGFPKVSYLDGDSCELGTSYSVSRLCLPILTPYQLRDGAGIQNGYVRVTTHRGGVESKTDFGVVMEGGQNTGIMLPQDSSAIDLSALSSSTGASYSNAAGVSRGLTGKALIADRGGNQVYQVDGNTLTLIAGSPTHVAGYSGDGASPVNARLNGPSAVLQVPRNWYYIADTGNHVVRVVDPVLNTIRTVVGDGNAGVQQDSAIATTTHLTSPVAFAVQRDGCVLIADVDGNTVSRYDPRTGTVAVIAGTGTAAHNGDGGFAYQAALDAPDGVAVGPDDAVYIAERDGNSIRRIDPLSGRISTIAGSASGAAGNSGDYDAAPTDTLFQAPGALYVERSGAIGVADIGNRRVRYITKPSSAGTQAARVLPFLAASTNSLRSLDRDFVLDGNLLLMPNGQGVLNFATAGTKLLTVVDNGAEQPDYPVSYNSHALTSGSTSYTFTDTLNGNTYPACDSFTQGLLTGEACQWGIAFAPGAPATSYPGAGTVGDSYGNGTSVQIAFTLNAVPPAPALHFAANRLDDATKGQPYTADAGVLTDGTTPYLSAVVASGALPGGASASLSGSTVVVSGTPTEAGTFTFDLKATDSAGTTATQSFLLQVQDALNVKITEAVHVQDTIAATAAASISFAEVVHVTDNDAATAAAKLSFTEEIHVGDALTTPVTATISVTEGIHIDDTAMAAVAPSVSLTEVIHVADSGSPQVVPTISLMEMVKVTDQPASMLAATVDVHENIHVVDVASPRTAAPIAFAIGDHTYGDAPIKLLATSPSPAPITYSYISGPASLSGNTLTLTGVGSVQVRASQAASGVFLANSAVASSTVSPATSSTSLQSSATPATEGATITFTATVSTTSSLVADGSVDFRDGATLLKTVALSGGSAQLSTAGLSVGTHTITAAYSGSSLFGASTASITQVIHAAVPLVLTGSGQGPLKITMKQGSSAQLAITVAPSGSFTGTVALSCSGLPSNMACGFLPASITFSTGGASQTVQLTITTATQAATVQGFGKKVALALLLPGLSFLLGGKRLRRRMTACIVSLVCICLAGLAGCGSSVPEQALTAPGTYAVNVVATSGSTTATLPLTVVVE